MSESENLSEAIVNKAVPKNAEVQNPGRRDFVKKLIPRREVAAPETKRTDEANRNVPAKTNQSPGVSRRTFLKGAAAGVVGAALPNIDKVLAQTPEPTHPVEQGETLKPSERAVFVDMSMDFDNQNMIRDLLGDLYAENLDLESTNTRSNISSLLASEDNRVVATLLANEALKSRQGHGEAMAGKYVETLSDLGYSVETPQMLPLQEAFGNIEFSRDVLGNPSIIMETDEGKIGDMLEEYFRENPNAQTVNLSLQLGKARVKQVLRQVIPLQTTNEFEIYDEEAKTEFVTVATDIQSWAVAPDGRFLPHRMVDGKLTPLRDDEFLTLDQYDQLNQQHEQEVVADYQADRSTDQIEEVYRNEVTEMYNPEFARENLVKLVALCRRFPDKSFNVSGGNENSFFYEIKQEMEAAGEWADNLTILAGEEDKCDGADIYLEEYRFNRTMPISSSESAARVTALDSLLANQGVPLEERQQRIRGYCQPIEFETSAGSAREALSLDPSLFTPELSNQAQ